MQSSTKVITAPDGAAVFVRHWRPEDPMAVRAVVVISHGLAEHGARYERLASVWTAAGLAVFAHDHRGHGQTAASKEDLGHFADRDGWRLVVEDLLDVVHSARSAHPDVPVVLLAHSMGSTIGVSFLAQNPGLVDGVILSGPVGSPPPLVYAGKVIARAERLRLGRRGRSALLMKMSFGDFNKPFEPARTEFDWLSRDPDEVDKYIADPLCGFDVTTQNWIDHLHGISKLRDVSFLARIPTHLPIFLVAGTMDPVGGATKQLTRFLERLGEAGLQNVEHRFWDGGRHELLNDTVRDEVVQALYDWMDRKQLIAEPADT